MWGYDELPSALGTLQAVISPSEWPNLEYIDVWAGANSKPNFYHLKQF